MGSIEAEVSGRSIPLGPPRQRGILAVLAADAGRLVLMDTLVDRVWGDAPPARVRDALYVYIARLRRILAAGDGSAVLLRRTHGYVLDVAEDTVDVHRFRRLVVEARQPHQDVRTRTELLRAALAQWSGTPLAAMPGEWADAVRQAWQGQRVDAVVEWAEAELSVFGPAAVIDTLTGMLIQHPLHEPLAATLMRAMRAAGRTGEALDIYARLRAELAEQLGIDPSAPLRRAHEEMLRSDAGLPTDGGALTGRGLEPPKRHERLTEAYTGTADPVISVVAGAELLQVLGEHEVRPAAEDVARVAESAVQRLSTQDEATRRLAQSLVVLGDDADWPLAAALSGLSDAESRDHADRLRRIGVVAPDGAARFSHPSIRSILAETAITPTELAAGHARAAELLYADGAPPEQVATHLLLADPGPGQWRVEVLREAARAARGRGLPETGTRYLRRALREPTSTKQRGDVILDLGADEMLSDPDAAARRLALALPRLTDPLTRGRAASLLADALFAAYRHEQAMDVLERAVADLATQAGSDTLLREQWWRVQAQLVLVGYERPATLPKARVWAERLRALGIPGDTPGQRAVLLALATPAMIGEGDAATVNDLLDRGLRGELAADARATYVLGVAGLGYTLTDRLDDAALRYDQMRELAGRCGATVASAQAVAGLVNVEWRRGERIPLTPRFDGALRTDLRARLSLVTVAVESLVELGDPAAAADILDQHAKGATDESVRWAPVLVSAGRVQAERGDLSGALALLLAYGGFERQEGLGTPVATPWRTLAARICAALGQREQARQLATEELDAAYRWGTARVIGTALRCLGAVSDGTEARALLAEAVAVLEPSPARLELAWAKYEWGLAVREAGDLQTGLDILGAALKLAELSGARLLAGRARAELVAAGVRVSP
ncbi:AfsR/SARP family transcriptional regulator [Kutzneria sp. CA-103260]|uniref:AfsR/SARP family transcriptional regulator n=1 Tax=Kutzneria sp. CA-103260 TaxID=2802641 RepID=UPI001BAA08B4|nr:AfsR/SARP family transcriptional regulator [Kutzneria sp. CA-103260]